MTSNVMLLHIRMHKHFYFRLTCKPYPNQIFTIINILEEKEEEKEKE